MSKWSGWQSAGGGESQNEKTTQKDDGGYKEETLRTIEGDKNNHQHSWVDYNEKGEVTGGGSTPDRGHKSKSYDDESDSSESNSGGK